jgi:hypothetical protein
LNLVRDIATKRTLAPKRIKKSPHRHQTLIHRAQDAPLLLGGARHSTKVGAGWPDVCKAQS